MDKVELETLFSKMEYPFGRCPGCGKDFSDMPLLREAYHITHCPFCGLGLDDIHSPKNETRDDDLYCDSCGRRIWESYGGNAGNWIAGEKENTDAGICSGSCERELCGSCADWDVNGECKKCRNSPCGQCPRHDNEKSCSGCELLEERNTWPDRKSSKETGQEESREYKSE
jgi:hypothetical protein